jgi:hypothetical protein
VVVNQGELTDLSEYWGKADDHLLRECQTTHRLSAPAKFIVHSLSEVNWELSHGRPFFVGIVRDGIALYEAEGHEFAHPKVLTEGEARAEAQKYFDHWFQSATESLIHGQDGILRGWSNKAFELHRATERLYHCVLLVLTLYKPLCRARHKGL